MVPLYQEQDLAQSKHSTDIFIIFLRLPTTVLVFSKGRAVAIRCTLTHTDQGRPRASVGEFWEVSPGTGNSQQEWTKARGRLQKHRDRRCPSDLALRPPTSWTGPGGRATGTGQSGPCSKGQSGSISPGPRPAGGGAGSGPGAWPGAGFRSLEETAQSGRRAAPPGHLQGPAS